MGEEPKQERPTQTSKVRKILSIIGSVFLYLLSALCLLALIFVITAKRSEDGAVGLFGHEMRIVLSGSMEKSDMTDVSAFEIKDIPVKSLVISEKVPETAEEAAAWYAKLKAGDVLTFRYPVAGRQETITHRIVSIEAKSGGYRITLRGDNRSENEEAQVIDTFDADSSAYVLGKVVSVNVVTGYIIYILQQPMGIAFVVIVPSAIVMTLQIFRIVKVLKREKRKGAEPDPPGSSGLD